MDALAARILNLKIYGLTWNVEAQKIDIAFGLKKLRMSCIIEDDKVTSDVFLDEISAWEDDVQSVDIVAFQKI